MVLAHWFGAAGLLAADSPESPDPDARIEQQTLMRQWAETGQSPLNEPLKRGGARPWNSPERRMVGLFHHLFAARGEPMKAWLKLLKELDTVRDESTFRRSALTALRNAFPTPAEEPWARRVSYSAEPVKEALLVGDDRVAIVLVNAIVPFFLAYSRRKAMPELEKVLYRLFLVLPGEGPNARTRFMTQRLMPLRPMADTLRTQQGLIQIHQDFCTSFESGCGDCKFPDLIAKATQLAGDRI